MNDNTIKHPAAILANSTTLTLIGIALFAIIFREQRSWRDGLLGASDSAFYGVFAVSIAGAILLGMFFKHYRRIDRLVRLIVGDLVTRLRKQEPLVVEEMQVSDAAHQRAQSKLDEIANRIYNDEPAWSNPYLLLAQMKCELQQLEYQHCNRFIILEYLSFLNYCMSRLEDFVWPENYFAMVHSVRMGGDEFLDDKLYPYIAKAMSEASSGADDLEIQRRIIRLYLTDNECRRLFPDVEPTTKPRMDEVEVIDLAIFESRPIAESGGDNV